MKMKKAVQMMAMGWMIGLAGCSVAATRETAMSSFTEQNSQIVNYHVLVQGEQYTSSGEVSVENGTKMTTVAKGSLYSVSEGNATRIDKEQGKTINNIEVLADGTKAKVRSYQEEWQEVLSPQSALENAVVYSYEEAVRLIQDIASVGTWASNGDGYTLEYSGSSEAERQVVSNFLEIKLEDNATIQLKAVIQQETKYVTSVQLDVLQVKGDQTNIKTHVNVQYSGFGKQEKVALPQ